MPRRTIATHGPDPVDVHVGSRIRVARTLAGMSQTMLADKLGLTFQQVQKNERGMNRVGASRLLHLSRHLDVPIMFFFEGLDQPAQAAAADVMMRRETLELVRAYYEVLNPGVRAHLMGLIRAVADAKLAEAA